jgi:hypothetical protein
LNAARVTAARLVEDLAGLLDTAGRSFVSIIIGCY